MHDPIAILLLTAASIGFFHTLAGPDHYIPFIAMARARRWSLPKTMVITFACGVGHVLGSVALGFLGIAVGVALGLLEGVESVRGDIAAWLLTGFGIAYAAWGLRKALRLRSHAHAHSHEDGGEHAHVHDHAGSHAHVHAHPSSKSITPWVLFTIFVLGPCEPLIPMLMYPAAVGNAWGVAAVAAVFSIVTIATMMATVALVTVGIGTVRVAFLRGYEHALAGAAVAASGLMMLTLGL